MNRLTKLILSSALITMTSSVFAAPEFLTTTNSSFHGKVYAKIGAYKSPEPVLAQSTRNRKWSEVKFLCTIQRMPSNCTAEIIVEHDKSGQSESLGKITMNLTSGELKSETHPSAHYAMDVVGNAHVEVTSSSKDF